MSSLHPLTKLYFALSISAASVISANYSFIFSLFFVLLCIAFACKKGSSFVSTTLKALGILIVIIFLIQIFFYPGSDILWKNQTFRITQEGVDKGISLCSRILVIGSALILFFLLTKVQDLVKALEDAGLSPTAAFVVLATLQIIPQMYAQALRIMDAQKSRGMENEGSLMLRAKAFVPVLGPLILQSIASTEERAITLEARGFLAKCKKTSLHKLPKGKLDKLLPPVFLLFLVVLIICRIFL